MAVITKQVSCKDTDISILVDTISRSFQERLKNGIVTLGSRMTVPMFLKRFSEDAIVVAQTPHIQNSCIGVLVLSGEKDGYLELIAIDPEYKRSGVGQMLLEHAERIIRNRGGNSICSDTSVLMTSSVKWHLKNGFRKIAMTSYPSTDYYSFVFRKSLSKRKNSRMYDVIRFTLSSIHCILTKKTRRAFSSESKLTLEEIQQVSTDIMSKVHDFCMRNNIHYSLAYGSLIGAIRHKGFIPWDDDIDIIMPRPDYERFLATFHEPGLGLMSSYDPDSYILYSHVCDLSRTFVRTTFPFAGNCVGGVWIDIFPADAVSDIFEEFKSNISVLKVLFGQQIYYREVKAHYSSMPTIKKKLGLAKRKILRQNGIRLRATNREMEQIIQALPWGSTKHWSQMACLDEGEKMYQEIEDFEECIPVQFEGKQFMAMKGYDRSLRKIFDDYMQLPPEEDRKPHNGHASFYWIA